jgi:DNA polymerase-3 subunit gamma/tau
MRDEPYQVVARKYRPQVFETLVGQSHIAEGLSSAITTNRVGHAYLFTGARGTGKTSTARIFAKALNCVHGPTPTPCNECEICRDIAAGTDVDVIEIDGASNRNIDDIRQLRQNVAIRPSRARFKIYIIDEVHMLTNESFNALLKTLEEPPQHVKFIFATTNPEKVPITVLSRCQRFDFAPVATASIQQKLEEICRTEKVEADPAALQLVARRAAGSMRDSQSLLEQLLSVAQGKITTEDVHRLLGTARSGRLAELVAQLAARDAANALASIAAAAQEGVDIGQFAEQLVGYLRDMLAAALGASPEIMLHSTGEEYAELAKTGRDLGIETLLATLQIMDQALVRMKTSIHPRVLLEVAVVRICRLEALDDLAALVGQIQTGSAPVSVGPARPVAAPVRPAAPAVAPPTVTRSASESEAKAATATPEKKTAEVAPASVESNPEPPREAVLSPESAMEIWQQTLEALGDMTADMGRKATKIATSGPNRLAIGFPAEYSTQKEFCERASIRQRIEQAAQSVTGRTIRIDFELLPGTPKVVERAAPPPSKRQLMKDRERHPLVQQAMETFQAELVDVVEGRKE